jgi:alkyl hydroperoxide reductase subunit AhpC
MRRIGERALTFRVPAVVDGEVTYIDPEEFLGQWVALSFVPSLGQSNRVRWDEQGKEMEELGAALLVVPVDPQALHQEGDYSTGRLHFTIVGDPLGRLQRLYGGPTTHSLGRARTFLVDPEGTLRFHLIHSLNDRGMAALMEMLQTFQDLEIASLV